MPRHETPDYGFGLAAATTSAFINSHSILEATSMAGPRTAGRTREFTESVIREMTRVAREFDAINLAQGFPDFPAPAVLKEAACEAIRADRNQYAITWGSPRLRKALVDKYRTWYGMEVEGDREITVTCGATEAMAAVELEPGDGTRAVEAMHEAGAVLDREEVAR